ncbi:MAG: hypothetical protein MJZ28_12900, partial [Paludibacteraceae bacterium]|nr:hypothetical protein [Paludibacteraceae bacterium]
AELKAMLKDEQSKQSEEIKSELKELLENNQDQMSEELLAQIKELLNENQGEGQGGGNNDNPQDITLTGKEYSKPKWVAITADGEYAYSMTAAFELPQSLKAKATSDDIMAAFVGDECRAKASAKNGVFLLNIIGTAEESSKITIRYWNATTKYIFEASSYFDYVPDMIYGEIDNPKTFEGKPLQ